MIGMVSHLFQKGQYNPLILFRFVEDFTYHSMDDGLNNFVLPKAAIEVKEEALSFPSLPETLSIKMKDYASNVQDGLPQDSYESIKESHPTKTLSQNSSPRHFHHTGSRSPRLNSIVEYAKKGLAKVTGKSMHGSDNRVGILRNEPLGDIADTNGQGGILAPGNAGEGAIPHLSSVNTAMATHCHTSTSILHPLPYYGRDPSYYAEGIRHILDVEPSNIAPTDGRIQPMRDAGSAENDAKAKEDDLPTEGVNDGVSKPSYASAPKICNRNETVVSSYASEKDFRSGSNFPSTKTEEGVLNQRRGTKLSPFLIPSALNESLGSYSTHEDATTTKGKRNSERFQKFIQKPSELYFVSRNKLRLHVVIEIFEGTHLIHEWQCTDLLQRINNQPRKKLGENPFSRAGVLTYRDCRQVFTDVHQIPSLEVRRDCIVICLPPVTCFILYDRVFLLVVEELKLDGLLQLLTKSTEYFFKAIRTDCNFLNGPTNRPFEFIALECIISTAFEQLNEDIVVLEGQLETVAMKVEYNKSSNSLVLEELHLLKEPVSVYDDRVNGFDKAFNKLIADTEDLKRMEITRYFSDPELYEKDRKLEAPNPDLQILLEYFDQELDQFSERVRRLKASIENTERLLGLRLAISRNRLIQLDLGATIIGTGIAVGACLTGIFGMNLTSGYEQTPGLFSWVSTIVSLCCGSAVFFVIFLFKRMIL
ncbi:CorA family Mg2+ transporter protein [Cardiosporidium cionae]|uniref:CorA family Mg2+ transporter protein n=1 Tax=Cardiosporidium cionae TaxID=476202 RepID=A0ABQ7JDA4_9APIC|nr:CorA family Mg2+ transporter protein [Cardiosporidium cionae]|eukprot:KAF8821849.1 CorA family Mg2+ transporter protein [Cardiosporidium cionae]